eukprot:6656018-Prymnesium_polylepis.3
MHISHHAGGIANLRNSQLTADITAGGNSDGYIRALAVLLAVVHDETPAVARAPHCPLEVLSQCGASHEGRLTEGCLLAGGTAKIAALRSDAQAHLLLVDSEHIIQPVDRVCTTAHSQQAARVPLAKSSELTKKARVCLHR